MRLLVATAVPAALFLAGCSACSSCHRCHGCHGEAIYESPAQQETAPAPAPAPAPQAKTTPIRPTPETFETTRIVPVDEPMYGHAADYRWLVGRLYRVHLPDGEWKLRYAPLNQEDKWGGSVVLSRDIRLESYKDGDFVRVEGEILAARPSLYLAGPLYRIRAISPAATQFSGRSTRSVDQEIVQE